MRKKDPEDEKKIYRLWYEYLKRSTDYQDFCDWTEKKRKDSKLPPPEKFRKDPRTGSAPKEVLTFLHFRNVHKVSFDKWWLWFKNKIDFRKTEQGSTPKRIEHFSDSAEFHIERYRSYYKKLHGKEPSMDEFQENFPKWLKDGYLYPGHAYLMVRVEGEDPADLKQSFTKIIAEDKKKAEKRVISHRRYWKPTTRIHPYELQKYLDVWDMKKKGMKPPEILQRIRPKPKGDIANQERQVDDFRAKADKIIRNVERGYFPGPYARKKTKKG